MTVEKGVPQDSILGPFLFTLYINQILLPSFNCMAHFYADDTILYAVAHNAHQAFSQLQIAFNSLQYSSSNLELVLNATKTKCMHLTRSRIIDSHTPIYSLKWFFNLIGLVPNGCPLP